MFWIDSSYYLKCWHLLWNETFSKQSINKVSMQLWYLVREVFFASMCILFPNFRFALYLEFGTNHLYEWLNFKMFCLHCRIWYIPHWEVANLAHLTGFPTDLPRVMQASLSHDLNSSCYFSFRYCNRVFKNIL